MIEASFGRTGRGATVDGAYQYDTGQRLRMRGLPSPDELSERDDFLAGDVVTVQAHYSFTGDSQTEARVALWDEVEGVWVAAIPDVYLRRNSDVHVYVYVSYGSTEESMRTKTCYEAVFRPISRPAPSDNVTPDQTSEWESLVAEVTLALSNISTATSNANAAATAANEAANKLNDLSAEAVTLAPGSAASANIVDQSGRKRLVIGVPKGEKGDQGVPGVFSINGQEVTNNAKVEITAESIGAMPANKQTVFEFSAVVPSSFWNGSAAPYTARITNGVSGILETDSPVVDVVLDDAGTMDAVLEAYGRVTSITTGNGVINLTCLKDKPSTTFTIRLLCVR